MGGELGSLTASLLEAEPWVGSLMGIDVDPPRRRLRRAEFHLIDPSDRERIVDTVTRFNPHVMVHLAVWEPDARAAHAVARRYTHAATTAIVGGAAECPAMEALVVRSGIEVYGRHRDSPTRPTETSRIDPSSEYGTMLADIESTARAVGKRVNLSVAKLRLAPVIGPHVPSPLGRLLRMPIVPFSMLADSPLAVIEDRDAAAAFVAAAARRYDGPVNVVAQGAITVFQAARRGNRIPYPIVGPEWAVARRLCHIAGAPVPDHVLELMHRGRLADASLLPEALGVAPQRSTPESIDRLHAWESVVHMFPNRSVA